MENLQEKARKLEGQLVDMQTICKKEKREPNGSERRRAADILHELETLEARHEFSKRQPIRPSLTSGPMDTGSPFPSPGEFLKAVAMAGSSTPVVDSRLRNGMFNAVTGLQEGLPSDGGFLVDTQFSTELMRNVFETGQVANRCRKLQIGPNFNGIRIPSIDETSRVTGSRWGGVRSYWMGEADELQESRPKFRVIELSLKKLTGLCYVTDELLQDATALASIVTSAFSEEFAFQLDDSVINGSGVGQPLGVMRSPALVTILKESGQLAKTLEYANIVNMWSRLHSRSRGSSVWLINQDIEPQLYQMGIVVGMGGTPVYLPPGGASGSPYGTLFGRPVIAIEQCQTLGDAGDIILGDFSQYILIDKGGVEGAQSIHVRFAWAEQVFRFIYRCDGMPIWNSALTPFKGSNTLSPFITLETRS